MATYTLAGYDDNQLLFPGGTPSLGETITFTAPADHAIVITDDDAFLHDNLSGGEEDGDGDDDDGPTEDTNQTAQIYDEFGALETSGQIQPRERVVLDDGTNTHVMHRVYIAASNSHYYIFEDLPPDLNTTYTVTSVTTPNATPYANFSSTGVTCFTRGALVATPHGWRAVERLTPGTLVMTMDHRPRRIMWAGHRHVSGADMRANRALQPFRVRAGTLGHGRPARDMLPSRHHRVLLAGPQVALHSDENEALVPIFMLESLPGIERVCPAFGVDYFHFATRQHELVFAEGMPTETLLVTPYSGRVARESMAEHDEASDADAIFPGLSRLGLDMRGPARPIFDRATVCALLGSTVAPERRIAG